MPRYGPLLLTNEQFAPGRCGGKWLRASSGWSKTQGRAAPSPPLLSMLRSRWLVVGSSRVTMSVSPPGPCAAAGGVAAVIGASELGDAVRDGVSSSSGIFSFLPLTSDNFHRAKVSSVTFSLQRRPWHRMAQWQ